MQENILNGITEEDLFESEEEAAESDPVPPEHPFDPKQVKFSTMNLSLENLIRRMKDDPPSINLRPEFQREEIWTQTMKSLLIESILLRFPLPAFYFDGSQENNWEVIDGQQRLITLRDFVVEKKLKLINLEYLKQLDGLIYDELPRDFQRRIEEAQFTIFLMEAGTPPKVKFNIFRRINTGSAPLSSQEIRHALNQGKPANTIQEMANLPSFKSVTPSISLKPKRMLDRDFVSHFVAFYLKGYKNYKPDMDTFLNEGMEEIENMPDPQRETMIQEFNLSMETIKAIMGEQAFRKRVKNGKTGRGIINKSLFEIWSVCLAKRTNTEREMLINRRDKIEYAFTEIFNKNDEFNTVISFATNDKTRTVRRFEIMENMIQNILDEIY